MRYKVSTPPDVMPVDDDSTLSLYRSGNDKNLFNMIDYENIKLSGSRVLVYKYIPSDDYDEVYGESRKKVISVEPVELWAHYDPRPIEENLSQFGVEVQSDQVFIFNKSYCEKELQRPIVIGDVIKAVFQNMKFEVYEVQEDSFEAYGVYHLMVHAKLLRDTEDIHNEAFFDRSNNIGGKI